MISKVLHHTAKLWNGGEAFAPEQYLVSKHFLHYYALKILYVNSTKPCSRIDRIHGNQDMVHTHTYTCMYNYYNVHEMLMKDMCGVHPCSRTKILLQALFLVMKMKIFSSAKNRKKICFLHVHVHAGWKHACCKLNQCIHAHTYTMKILHIIMYSVSTCIRG